MKRKTKRQIWTSLYPALFDWIVLLKQLFPYELCCSVGISDSPHEGCTFMSYLELIVQTALRQRSCFHNYCSPVKLYHGVPQARCPFPGFPGVSWTLLPDLDTLWPHLLHDTQHILAAVTSFPLAPFCSHCFISLCLSQGHFYFPFHANHHVLHLLSSTTRASFHLIFSACYSQAAVGKTFFMLRWLQECIPRSTWDSLLTHIISPVVKVCQNNNNKL